MDTLSALSKTDLEKMTKTQLIDAIVGDKTDTVCTKSEDCEHGQVVREFVTRDSKGMVVKVDSWFWTYKENGDVDTITHEVTDGNKVLETTCIEHGDTVKMVAIDFKEIVEP